MIGWDVSKGVIFCYSFSFWPCCLVYIMYTFRCTSGFLNTIAFTYQKKKKKSWYFIVWCRKYEIVLKLIWLVQNDIRKNPAFRSQFHEMCAKVGVDPLASNKGFWAELLGIGDFYYELGWFQSTWWCNSWNLFKKKSLTSDLPFL